MTVARARRGLALLAAAALTLPTGVAQARHHRAAKPAPAADKAYIVPDNLSQLCVADAKPLQQALAAQWTPAPASLDQWSSLARTIACDLSGARDLGWHRVPLRTYATTLRFPFTWIESQGVGSKAQRRTRVFRSSAQLPSRLEFNVSGSLQEVRYDAHRGVLSARFLRRDAAASSSHPAPIAPPPPPGQCAGTQLQFQQQNGVWLLSGVEPVPGSPC
ncbi:hypothetical protein AB6Q13_04765 [Ralstonia solanacearum]|uniref:hypothetical protein n=1 Tax=Ralstonia solanacearum TaxID=305 RepID=UPI002306A505|nr:hypothetical protein [Ralstonia solanacearum]MDB0565456.1 hypothetical protein [Ralstonia solanacearum]MDB0574512.1 hypothetical protein [Ralstonia solanacearum]